MTQRHESVSTSGGKLCCVTCGAVITEGTVRYHNDWHKREGHKLESSVRVQLVVDNLIAASIDVRKSAWDENRNAFPVAGEWLAEKLGIKDGTRIEIRAWEVPEP